MDALRNDLKHSIRQLRKSPGFSLTAIAALALGIGATTAIFSIVNTVVLKPLPIPNPDRFVMLSTSGGNNVASPAKFEYWRSQSSVIEDVTAFHQGVMNYTGSRDVEQLRSLHGSSNVFRCWGIEILYGRGFTPLDELSNGPRIVVIGKSLWTRRFAGDPGVIGRTILLNEQPYTVIGVVADSLGLRELGDGIPEVYVPVHFDPESRDHGDFYEVVARLKPGITLEQAKARLKVAAAEFRIKFPNMLGPKESFTVKTFRESFIGEFRPLLLLLSGAASLVLLIACANVANLLLVQAAARKHEIAIRSAIGAGRQRLVRQFLTESTLLALVGGALGTWLGYGSLRWLLTLNTADLPRVGETGQAVTMDWRVMAFALGVSLVTAIAFGVFPALSGSREDLTAVMKGGGRHSGTGLKQSKARASLVISEVSLAVALLVASALLIRTIVAMYTIHRGFETNNVVTMRTSLTGLKHQKTRGVAETIRNGLEQVRSLPGVLTASATWCCVPLQGSADLDFEIVGRPAGYAADVGWSTISPGFFDVFKIPLKRGRAFTDRDDGRSPAVAVINESLARMYWKNSDPLQDRIVMGKGTMPEFKDEPARQIIGIVSDVRDEGLDSNPRPIAYVPQAQLPDEVSTRFNLEGTMSWVVRTQSSQQSLAPTILKRLRQSTGLPVSDVRSMDQVVSLSTARQRFNATLMTVFGSSALLLAAIGIYGLMAYSVEQRTREIGIRLALGAQSNQVRNMVVRQGMGFVLAGIVIGVGAAWSLSRLMESFLFGVQARDPIVFTGIPLVLSVVAFMAVWVPAARASRVNAVESLRHE